MPIYTDAALCFLPMVIHHTVYFAVAVIVYGCAFDFPSIFPWSVFVEQKLIPALRETMVNGVGLAFELHGSGLFPAGMA